MPNVWCGVSCSGGSVWVHVFSSFSCWVQVSLLLRSFFRLVSGYVDRLLGFGSFGSRCGCMGRRYSWWVSWGVTLQRRRPRSRRDRTLFTLPFIRTGRPCRTIRWWWLASLWTCRLTAQPRLWLLGCRSISPQMWLVLTIVINRTPPVTAMLQQPEQIVGRPSWLETTLGWSSAPNRERCRGRRWPN